MGRWLPRSVRARLTLWYAGVLAAILVAYAAGVYLFLRQNLYAELDRALVEDFETAEEALERGEDGRIARRGPPVPHAHEEGEPAPARWLEVWSRDGELLYGEAPERADLAPLGGGASVPQGARVETIEAGPGWWLRTRRGLHPIGGTPVLIRVARSEARVRHELGEFLVGMGLGLPAAVGVACVGGYLLAGRALKPVGEMAVRARTITAERLGERLPIENPDDELGELGTVFNETLARLERSFEALRRFTADAAHELRTPLTALRSVGEVALGDAKREATYRETIGSMLEEADRLARLVDVLLTLSRADSGRVEIHRAPVALRAFAQEISDLLRVLAEEKSQAIVIEGDSTVQAWADPAVLRQAVINILDNAIRHSPSDGRIRIVVAHRSGEAVLEVIDQGDGIPEADRERIFDRFYRADKARARKTGGAGLGLSIARWAVEANGGRIEVESGGGGSCFRVWLPLWSPR